MKRLALIFGLSVGGFLATSQAQFATRVATQRQISQHHRIQQGRCSGDLTRQESKQLMRQQRRITQHKRLAKADGYVSPREKAAIRNHQQAASQTIYRKKHNARERI